jgi:dihydroorotate dehydrogenase
MYALIRPLLFLFDEELLHRAAMSLLRYMPTMASASNQAIHTLGLEFPHPVGIAAGLDKNGEYLKELAKLNPAFIEIGTVTPQAQVGNPKPRVFRIPKAEAIINRMGFPNLGVDVLVENVKKADFRGILGINIGKNKETSLENAADDYVYCLRKVYPHASYVTINVSSPNTPDLRQLQQRKYFSTLLTILRDEQYKLRDQYQHHVPLVIKLSPDESDEALKRMAHDIVALGIEGIILTNTTSARDGICHLNHGQELGGLSGAPLRMRASECLAVVKKVVGSNVSLIGVGGVHSIDTATEKLNAGASLLQVYTGLIYQGPHLIKHLVDGLSDMKGV